ncbi:MAG TPA: aldo/keto reductase [Candidatus Hydrogenedentes bacterium]|nr:aldo/keto reductase [Candidatus Hydrogenedentota bacterium]
MEYRKLGSSDLEVSVLSFGAWQLGDPEYWGADDRSDGETAVHAAVDIGINLFDTAEGYGRGASEAALGTALGKRRSKVLIASKVSAHNCAPAKLRQSCEASLRRLRTDVIDLYQVHWPFRDVRFEDPHAELVRLKKEGKIREIGVSNFGKQDLDDWMRNGGCVSNQLGYNLLFRAIEHEILPSCQKHGVGILAYMPLMQGLLTGRWETVDEVPRPRCRTRHFASSREGVRHGEPGCEELVFDALGEIKVLAHKLGQPMAAVAIAWLMAQSGVTSVIVGARNAAQVPRNAAAAELTLPPDAVARLNEITDPVKQRLGANADMWQGGDGSRIR